MHQTIRLSSCVSANGEFVTRLQNGEVLVRDGANIYRGKPIARYEVDAIASGCALAERRGPAQLTGE